MQLTGMPSVGTGQQPLQEGYILLQEHIKDRARNININKQRDHENSKNRGPTAAPKSSQVSRAMCRAREMSLQRTA